MFCSGTATLTSIIPSVASNLIVWSSISLSVLPSIFIIWLIDSLTSMMSSGNVESLIIAFSVNSLFVVFTVASTSSISTGVLFTVKYVVSLA